MHHAGAHAPARHLQAWARCDHLRDPESTKTAYLSKLLSRRTHPHNGDLPRGKVRESLSPFCCDPTGRAESRTMPRGAPA